MEGFDLFLCSMLFLQDILVHLHSPDILEQVLPQILHSTHIHLYRFHYNTFDLLRNYRSNLQAHHYNIFLTEPL
jgi:hypothetical protein